MRDQIGLGSITGKLGLLAARFVVHFIPDACHCDAALFCYATQIGRNEADCFEELRLILVKQPLAVSFANRFNRRTPCKRHLRKAWPMTLFAAWTI